MLFLVAWLFFACLPLADSGWEDVWVHGRPSPTTLVFLGTKVQLRTMSLYEGVWNEFLERTRLGRVFPHLTYEEQDCAIPH